VCGVKSEDAIRESIAEREEEDREGEDIVGGIE
jgi:hypothetical protein